jgi:signal transduction histidine kinase
MSPRPSDLADVLRQALGNPAQAVEALLAASLAPGESAALFLLEADELRLAGAVPAPAPFVVGPVRALAERVARAGAAASGPTGAPDPVEAPDAPGAVAVPLISPADARGALVVLAGSSGVSQAMRTRAARLAERVVFVAELDIARIRARQAESRLAQVRQIAAVAKPGRSLAEVSQEVLDVAVELLDGDTGALWLRARARGGLTLGAARRVLGRRPPRPRLSSREVAPLTGGTPVLCPPSPLGQPRALLRDEALGAAVLLPLHRDGELVGVLVVARSAMRPFAPGDPERVLELAEVAAVPLVEACLREELRARRRQVGAGRRIARVIGAGPALEEFFRVAVHELGRLVDFDGAVLLVPATATHGRQTLIGERGKPPRVLADAPDVAGDPGGGIPLDRAVILPHIGGYPDPRPAYLRELPAARALLAVPLTLGGDPCGSLVLVSHARGQFRRVHLRQVRAVAEHLALAIRLHAFRRAATASVEDRLRLTVRLARAERYATIGRLASALAHEVRNPLTVIGATVQYLRDRLPAEHEHRPLLDAADRKVREMDESLENLLSFARPLEIRPRAVPLGRLLADVATFVRARAERQAVEVVVDVEPGLPEAQVDPRLLEQAMLNLALNGLDAMERGGRLTFTARPAAEAGNLLVTVADTGTGIDDAELGLIFEPYYTTKRRGTGLGLALTRRIVEEHGGAIDATSELGRGTTFTLVLPAASVPASRD